MMATRRIVLSGMVAAPVVLGLGSWIRLPDMKALFLYHESFEAWPQIAAARELGNTTLSPLRGDRVRQMRGILADMPDRIVGITLSSDALLLHDIAREAGYSKGAEMAVSKGGRWQPGGWDGLAELPLNAASQAVLWLLQRR